MEAPVKKNFASETRFPTAPDWEVDRWFNTQKQLSVDSLRGLVIVVHAFQMLCPGCVAHGIPQAMRVAKTFEGAELAVVGLHTVFEHHEAMRPHALEAFLHEYKVTIPVGVDMAGKDGDHLPRTMKAYAMRGTPTTILIDRQGLIRSHVFGAHDDMLLGAEIATLLLERASAEKPKIEPAKETRTTDDANAGCDDNACRVS